MASKAQSFVDVVLGEATSGTPAQRYEDMRAIASAVVNRANALGVSPEDVISVESEFNAFGKSLPPGVEQYRSLAEQAVAEVQTFGPTHPGMFYATPSAVDNLPSGLQPVAQTAGHVYFDDPQNRSIKTAKGYIAPNKSKGLGLAALAPNGLIDSLTAPVSAAVDFAQGLYSRFSPVQNMDVAPMPPTASAGLQFANPNQSSIAPSLEDALMGVSAELGQPLGITSGYRSPAYNAAVGGAKRSMHTKGLAADIDMTGMTPAQRQDLVTELTQRGVGGLIAYSKSPNMLHVDMRARDPAASPHFMFDRTAARMPNAPDWFKDMAEWGGIKTPDVAPVPPSRTASPVRPDNMAFAGPKGQFNVSPPSPVRPDNFASPGVLVGAKPGGLASLGGVPPSAPKAAPADPYASFETARATAFSNMPAPPTASIDPAPVASVPSLTAPAVASISPTAISASAFAPAAPVASLAPKAVTPTTFTPAVAPAVRPPTVRVAPVTPPRSLAPQAPRAAQTVRAAPAPAFTAADVYSGRAPAGAKGAAAGGNVVSIDALGNRSVTNKYGATTVTDPSGRQVAQVDLGKVGDKLRDAAPGMVGSIVGGAIGGPLGAIAGGVIGNKAAGKTGGLGGLGGFLGGLFGGGSSSGSRGGSSGSSGGGSRGGGGSRSSGPAGRDRDHAGGR